MASLQEIREFEAIESESRCHVSWRYKGVAGTGKCHVTTKTAAAPERHEAPASVQEATNPKVSKPTMMPPGEDYSYRWVFDTTGRLHETKKEVRTYPACELKNSDDGESWAVPIPGAPKSQWVSLKEYRRRKPDYQRLPKWW